VKVAFIATAVAITIHWIACGWMLLSPRTVGDDVSFYIISLYWSVTTLTTVGYGDITPDSNFARIYTMGVMLVGVGVYGIIIGQISRLMMLADKYTEARKEKMNTLHQYMKHYNIPPGLQGEVYSFYNHLLQKNITEEDSTIISDLPQALQNELNIYTKIKLIKNVHIFKECTTPCLKMIAQKLEQTFHSPNEYIIRKGDRGEEMFIIGHGEVQVRSGENIIAELKQGQFFGETALIRDTIRNADIQASAYCDLYTLKKDDFLAVIEKYPSLEIKFKELYNKRSTDRKPSTKKAA
jgi:voltage-gated potassium channel